MKKYIRATRTINNSEVQKVNEQIKTWIQNKIQQLDSFPPHDTFTYGAIIIDVDDTPHPRIMFTRLGDKTTEYGDMMSPKMEDTMDYDPEFSEKLKAQLVDMLKDIDLYQFVERIHMIKDGDRGVLFYNAVVRFDPDIYEYILEH